MHVKLYVVIFFYYIVNTFLGEEHLMNTTDKSEWEVYVLSQVKL